MNKDTGLWVFAAPFGVGREMVYIGNNTSGWEMIENSADLNPPPSHDGLSGSYLNLSGMLSSGKMQNITTGDVDMVKEFIE